MHVIFNVSTYGILMFIHSLTLRKIFRACDIGYVFFRKAFRSSVRHCVRFPCVQKVLNVECKELSVSQKKEKGRTLLRNSIQSITIRHKNIRKLLKPRSHLSKFVKSKTLRYGLSCTLKYIFKR